MASIVSDAECKIPVRGSGQAVAAPGQADREIGIHIQTRRGAL